MSTSVAALVEQSHLQLEVLAGAGSLGRRVSSAHASDLPDPWHWLAGGELLMKNGRSMAGTARRQIAFLEGLAAASVAALVIGNDPMTPEFTGRAAARADELRLPVLQIPYSVSFIAISRAVGDASAQEQSRRLTQIEHIYAIMRGEPASAVSDPGEFVGRLGTELGHHVYLVDLHTTRPVLGSPAVPEALARALHEAIDRSGQMAPGVVHLPGRGRHVAVCLVVPFEEPTLLVATRADGRVFDLATLHHAAAAVAFELTRETLREDLHAQVLAVPLADLLGETSGDVARGDLDVDFTRARLVAIGRAEKAVLRRAVLRLRRRGVPHLLVMGHDVAWLLVEVQDHADRQAGGSSCQGVLADIAALAGAHAAIGVSTTVQRLARLAEAAREARFALGTAVGSGGGVAYYGEGAVFPALHDRVAAQSLVGDVLGPVLAYDGQHGTTLTGSLAAFLSNQRSWSRTAATLHVHRQTVIYRMRRVAQLTGRDLTETADLAMLWLALTAHNALSGGVGTASRDAPAI